MNIEDRVVSMSFENSKFESGARGTIATLNRLNDALKNTGSGKGLNDISASANKVNLSHLGGSIDTIRTKLGALNVAAVAIFANIATQAASAAFRMVKTFTVQPIIAGLHEYQTNLNAVQTILANTQASGAKLKDVNHALEELNHYSDKTIYNFSEMAKNIGTFTAAGVDLDTSTQAIKGIANLAALSGSNSQQASTAMYQLSQAISAGRVSLQDWNSVVNAGMGGTVFQRALAQTAVKMGKLDEGALKLTGKMKNVSIAGESFRQSISAKPGEESWLTSKVLTQTLKQFTGDLTDAELAAQGFDKAQIKAIQRQAKTAQNAATQVKTLKQVLDVAQETASSGWAKTWQLIFGDFGEAKKTFTNLSNAVNDFINANSDARNKILKDWKELGGRTALIEGIKDVFSALGKIADTVSDAFKDIFPPKTGKDLYDLTIRFREFAKALTPGPETLENLKRTFRGFFAAISIGKQIISGIAGVIGELLGSLGKSSGGFLDFTGNVGDWLVSVNEALKKGEGLKNFFDALAAVIKAPFQALGLLKDALVTLFTGVDPSKVGDALGTLNDNLSPMEKLVDGARLAWEKFLGVLGRIHEKLVPVKDAIKEAFTNLGPTLAEAFSNINFDQAIKVLAVGLLGSIAFAFNKFVKGGFDGVVGKGLLAAISGSFKNLGWAFGGLGTALRSLGGLLEGLTGNLQALQQRTKAQALKEIAIALALLAASALALSFIPEKKLQSAMGGLAIGLGELVGAMALMSKIGVGLGVLKLPVLAAGLIVLAGALSVLTISVVALSMLKWENLVKGLTGVGAMLAALVLSAKPLAANSLGLVVAGVGLNAIAVAMNILSLAVNTFGNMDLGKLAKGIGAIGSSLFIIGKAITVFPKGAIGIGVALNAIAASLLLIAIAVEKFGGFEWSVIVKGLIGIGSALVVIGGAMRIMPEGMIQQSIALGILGLALQGIARAVGDFGGLSLAEIAKGLLTLAGSLLILGFALNRMEGTVRGAAALGLAAIGLRILVPALSALGKMSVVEIGKGLLTLGAAIAVLGLAGRALTPVAPTLMAFGVALLAIGGGLALAGIGIALVGTGLSAIAVSGPAAVKILVSAIVQLAEAIPKVAKDLVLGLLAIVKEIAKVAPQFATAMVAIGREMIKAIIELSPEMAKAITALIKMVIKVIGDNAGPLIKAGFELLKDILSGIERNIGGVVKTVGNIIVKFLNAIASKTPQIVTAGANILIKLLQGIANNLGRVISAGGDIIVKFIKGIADNFRKVIDAGGDLIVKIVSGIANNFRKVVDAGGDAIVKFVDGLGDNFKKVFNKGIDTAGKLIDGVLKGILRLVNVGGKAVIEFLNGVALFLRTRGSELVQAGANVAASLIQGIVEGLVSLPGLLVGKIGEMIKAAVNSLLGDEMPKYFAEEFRKRGLNPDTGKPLKFGVKNAVEPHMTEGSAEAITNWGSAVDGQMTSAFKAVASSITGNKTLLDISQAIDSSFAKSIRTSGKVEEAFTNLNAKVNDQIAIVKGKINTEQKLIDRMNDARKKDTAAIAEHTATLTKNKNTLEALKGIHTVLISGLDTEKNQMKGLLAEYGKLTTELDRANQTLKDRKQALADSYANVFTQFNAIPEIQFTDEEGNPIDPSVQLGNFKAALDAADGPVSSFAATLEILRGMKLNDDLYSFLVNTGTAASGFAKQLADGGQAAVDEVNRMDGELRLAAATMATNVSNKLFLEGVKNAQDYKDGLVKGTKEKKGTDQLLEEIDNLAEKIIARLKAKLKIKSPSQEFAKIGRLSTQGLAIGLRTSSNAVITAASDVGDSALSAIQDTMSRISDVVDDVVDLDPTIRPVLDLTQFHRDASKMGLINTDISAGHAFSISASQTETSSPDSEPGVGTAPVLKFEQHNSSPKALSEAEIYRQTNNLLSQAKSALGLR